MFTAMGLLLANAQSGVITVIIRFLKDLHWAPLAISARIFAIVEIFIVCLVLGVFLGAKAPLELAHVKNNNNKNGTEKFGIA